MLLHKLGFFATLAGLIVLGFVLRTNSRVKNSGLPQPSAVHLPTPTDNESSNYRDDPAKTFGESASLAELRAQGEASAGILLPVQSKNTKTLAVGKLLVASRDLADPHFVQTVILLVRYGDDGVLGLILNRRTDVPLSRVLDGIKAAKDRSDPVYLGGPVEMPSVFALLQSPAKIDGAERIFDNVYLITAKPVFEQTFSARPDPGIFHVYLGYAGWTKAQLQKEVDLGAWFIFPADTKTIFNRDPDALWPQMIRQTELKMAQDFPTVANSILSR